MDLQISSNRDKHTHTRACADMYALFMRAQILEGMSEMPRGRMRDAGTTKRSISSEGATAGQ